MNIQGIKCDNLACDYEDNNVAKEEYHLWLNTPCPKCTQNLLTEADFKLVQTFIKIENFPLVKFLNWVGNTFFWFIKSKKTSMEMNGDGKISKRKKTTL